jgi:serine/alanine adding enzyme
MKIQIIEEPPVSDRLIKSWSDFVFNHPSGNIFQSKDFFMLCYQTPGYKPLTVFAIDGKENICGVMQGVIMNERDPLISLFSARAIAWGGPLSTDLDTYTLLVEKYERALGKRVIYSQIRPIGPASNTDLLIRSGFKREPHLDIFNDLTGGEQHMFSKIQNEKRRKIRRSKDKGVIVRQVESDFETEAAVSLITGLYNNIGLPAPPRKLLTGAKSALGEAVKIFVAIFENKIIGSRIVLCYRDMVYEWYAASNSEYQNKYANDLLPWEVMLWASQNGFRIFDFGGAGNPLEKYGVRDFKLSYGGEVVEVSRFTHVHKPFFMLFGKKGIRLYRIIKKVSK